VIGEGEIYESSALSLAVYQEGYDNGFDDGFEEGKIDGSGPTEAELDDGRLAYYVSEFPAWVARQRMIQSVFACDSDIRLERPFIDDVSTFALWANHDCSDYDMLLNVMIDVEASLNLIGYVGAPLSSKEC